MRCWILIADAARAKVFSTTGRHEPLRLERELHNPLGRAKPHDIVTDDPGHYSGSGGKRGKVGSWVPSTPPDVVEEKRFAQKVAGLLGTGLARQEYDSVAIFAPAQFLGLLRLGINAQVRKHLMASVPKELTIANERELVDEVAPFIKAPV